MFERLKRRPGGSEQAGATSAGAGTAAPPEERDGTAREGGAVRHSRGEGAPTSPGPAAVARAHERQREAYGGINWGAAFFGWLVAVGMAVLLTGLLGAAGAAIGLTGVSDADVAEQSDTLTLGGAIALLVVLILAYACGGYVSGRMSRFDGARQGIGAWVIGLLVTLVIAIVALVAGAEYNVVERANLPRLPVGDETLSAGGAVTTIAILVATLAAAAAGGKLGERYHRKVDRAGFPG
jgi:amino acid transporter